MFAGGSVRRPEAGSAGAGREGHQYEQHTLRNSTAESCEY